LAQALDLPTVPVTLTQIKKAAQRRVKEGEDAELGGKIEK